MTHNVSSVWKFSAKKVDFGGNFKGKLNGHRFTVKHY